jgi:hypothetical protein
MQYGVRRVDFLRDAVVYEQTRPNYLLEKAGSAYKTTKKLMATHTPPNNVICSVRAGLMDLTKLGLVA